MAGVSMATHVKAPVSEVFQLFSDIENAPGRIKAIKKIEILTPGPVGEGTRFKETRIVFNREATEEMVFTIFEPDRRYALGCESCGVTYLSTFLFEPEGDGSRVTVDFRCKSHSVVAWLMMPLGWLMKGMMKKALQEDLDDMKLAAEAVPH